MHVMSRQEREGYNIMQYDNVLSQAREREGRERNQCGVCREPITGRPTALETFLRLN